MSHYLCIHRKLPKSVVFGLLLLILYTFYSMGMDGIVPRRSSRTGDHRMLIEIFPNPEKLNTNDTTSETTTNATGLQTSLESSMTQNNSQQSASSSIGSNNSSSVVNKTVTIEKSVKTNNVSTDHVNKSITEINKSITTSIPVPSDSVRAIYVSGHDVTVPESCPNNGSETKLVIAITSAPKHKSARIAIRQTWGSYKNRRDVSVIFVLGLTGNSTLEESLKNEQKLYGDIIRGRYIDSYENLTLKSLSLFEWTMTYCSKATFLLKTDDDMFINVPRLIVLIDKYGNKKNSIFGRIAVRWKPTRNPKSKYYISTKQWSPTYLPNFATGPAYMLSIDTLDKIWRTAMDEKFFKLEDVFLTGMVAQKIGIKRWHVAEFFNSEIPYNACRIIRGISVHSVQSSAQYDLWKKLLDGKAKCR